VDLDRLLYKILPPEWYLKLHGIKLYSEPPTAATVTYTLHGEEKAAQVKFGSAYAVVKMFPLWLKHGFLEKGPGDRYYIPPHDILKVEWWDPILEDYFAVY